MQAEVKFIWAEAISTVLEFYSGRLLEAAWICEVN